MQSDPVIFVWPGDLHLETADRENYHIAEWMVEQVNSLVRPDFVQFAGDNVQHATQEQFELFNGLCARLTVPYHALVGDHDAHHDPAANAFRANCGETYGAFSHGGYRFIRLNTMEFRPLGLSEEQIHWFRYQVDTAVARGEQVVVFQHHYPFQIWEDFTGPGIDAWRKIVVTRPITAIFSGHTHYGQIANDGHNVCIATRSIGDPEGGPPGYSIVYLHDEDLAITYRSIDDQGPIVMVTHPRDILLAQRGQHVVVGQDQCRVRTWSRTPVASVKARVNDGAWYELQRLNSSEWQGPLGGERLPKGENSLTVEAFDSEENTGQATLPFAADRSGRYTAVPGVRPEVRETKFC